MTNRHDHTDTGPTEDRLDALASRLRGEPDAGFDVDTNRATLIATGAEPEPLEVMSKDDLADWILDRVETLLEARS